MSNLMRSRHVLQSISKYNNIAKRFIAGRENCRFPVKQICKPKKLGKIVDKKKKKEQPFVSMWENPECCVVVCPDLPPRYDVYHYRISDKLKRKYPVTWAECNPIRKPTVKCCFEELDYPPIERRARKKPCAATEEKCQKDDLECPRLKLDNCRPVRNPPKCARIRLPTNCKKVCTPYPAYSECIQPSIKPLRPKECGCYKFPPLCVVMELIRKGLIKLPKRRKS